MRTVVIFMIIVSLSFGEKVFKYAAVIYRHGDRTPVDLYPTDPWRNESLWPVKFGELTNTGKQQHYALGKWLRKRYKVRFFFVTSLFPLNTPSPSEFIGKVFSYHYGA